MNTHPPDIRVGLVQINNSFSGQCYLPYSIGVIQSYLSQYSEKASRLKFLLPVYKRVQTDEAVKHLLEADLVLFSLYVWNIEISLEIARKLKAKKPSIQILAGGPQVPDKAEEFLRKNSCIDIAIHGEGEQTIQKLIDQRDSSSWTSVSGISYLDQDLHFHTTPKGPRLANVNSILSPYLNGVFDELMEANKDQKWIALWETNRGCPFSCTFCDWGSSTQSKVFQFDMARLQSEVDWFAKNKIDFIFCCDANFGILPRDVDIAQYVASIKQKTGFPKALSVQNTKNATERAYQVQKILSDAGLNKGVTLSMQSMDKETLTNIKRQNISLGSYQELQKRFIKDKIETYSDLILGLPGETYKSFSEGISKVIENGQHNRIQFNNLSILPNAEMGDLEYQKRFGMITIESEIINIHGSRSDVEHEILEKQQLVIATNSMPSEDWMRTRALCWMVAFLYFDKILQIPILLTQRLAGIPFKEIFESFAEGDLSDFPTVKKIRDFFMEKAGDIQQGGPEYCHSQKYLDIYWPADEYILIELLSQNTMEQFYEEAKAILLQKTRPHKIDDSILQDAILLNKTLLKKPFLKNDEVIHLNHNVMEAYKAALSGDPCPIEKIPTTLHVDRTSTSWQSWDDFCREVIWYGNKKGAYLYSNCKVEPQIAGIY